MGKEVIFDLLFAQPIGESKFHGGGEYIKTVFQALAERFQGEYTLTVCYDAERFLDDWIVSLIDIKKINKYHVKTADDIVEYVQERAKHGYVRFFAGMVYPYDKCSFPENATCIGTCHGLRVLEKPYDISALQYIKTKDEIRELLRMTLLKKRSVLKTWEMYQNSMSNFDVLITVSEHSSYSIRVNFPELVACKEINVFYTPDKFVPPLMLDDTVTTERYIMMISANRWLKNAYRGVLALDELYEKDFLKGIKTKVFGDLPERIKRKVKNKECFDFLKYVSTEDLEKAYRDCEVFFYPTLNEGFGLPPMEAMKYGKTCVVSAVCSLPEIYQDAVYYCNPYDIQEMENRLLNALEQPISQDRIEKQISRIADRQHNDMAKLIQLIMGTDTLQ